MTPHEIRAARQFVGLSLSHMAVMLGYKGKHTRQMMQAERLARLNKSPLITRRPEYRT